MVKQTKLSAKGQVVIPKDVRDALGLESGDALDVTVEGGRLVMERHVEFDPVAAREAVEALSLWARENIRYEGPYITDEMMRVACEQRAAEQDQRVREGR